ncbi:uncharacterized protein LOC124363379 [Homalodisca vitripennis]|uniref:uncharacterized protein LOC124363379 n=1 Tax=Homalodisca vitripennis TaxID=197043 RepID=UPI001EEA4A7D|nr:uncharacterized protein LOC124363379 [Homalodisca vitripennis]
MPTCAEIFYECQWHGSNVNCCEIFELQRTEQGYCWSFNSLTSEATSHCPLSEVLENEGMVEEDDDERLECELRRTTGISGGSGLQIYLRPTDPRHNIGYRAQRVVNGVSVTSISYFPSAILIHTSYELPLAGTGVFASTAKGARISLGIAAEITTSSDGIRSLPVDDRHCLFPDEEKLHIRHMYTHSTCLAECRYKYIMLMCRCKLYFFVLQEMHLPECGVLHLTCIAKHSSKFRFYRPPPDTPGITDRELMESLNCNIVSLLAGKFRFYRPPPDTPGITDRELMESLNCNCKFRFYRPPPDTPGITDRELMESLNCNCKFRFYRPPPDTPGITDRELMESLNCNCLATCFDTVYDIHLQRSIPEDPANQTAFSHVDIYYSKTGFVRYQRHIVFEFYQLIVSLGGVANLFLGCSLLSLIETIYWMLKILAVTLKTSSVKSKLIKVQPLNYLE